MPSFNLENTEELLSKLESGVLRSAEYKNGTWQANQDVKQAILVAFKKGTLTPMGLECNPTHDYAPFIDKHTIPPRHFSLAEGLRVVPGGSSIRRGTYLAKGVIVMPPSYINIGAYIDEGTMVDSHVLVGSCAQIGKRVHLSAGVQIGGVLEPIGQTPVIIEDDCFVGAGSVIVEGILVQRGAVIAPGTTLSKGTPVFDCVNEKQLNPGAAIPPYAVVVPGTRPVGTKYAWANNQGLQMKCALIIKYRDEKTNANLVLEEALR